MFPPTSWHLADFSHPVNINPLYITPELSKVKHVQTVPNLSAGESSSILGQGGDLGGPSVAQMKIISHRAFSIRPRIQRPLLGTVSRC